MNLYERYIKRLCAENKNSKFDIDSVIRLNVCMDRLVKLQEQVAQLTAELEARTTERDEARRVAVEMAEGACVAWNGENYLCTYCRGISETGYIKDAVHTPTCPVLKALEWREK